ncbi:vacuolar protein sorting-associated protein 8 homolog [Neodiprion pinetum]|uniref:vacuolar protein sorting-associated protein 8 homolog n=1 Tax=Neodiprion pinetum TaxID=441929 RepID=UPI001EE015B2|nr:vacuolar protein sorting-associated protein 8 homolog [Neodiprion pinetum]
MAENVLGSEIGFQDYHATEAIHLDIEELDDAEYAIPAVEEPPSLESILTELDSGSLSGTEDEFVTPAEKLGGSETASVGSLLSLNSVSKPFRPSQSQSSSAILRHVILKGISSQISSASERINAGLASAMAAGGNMLVIGTSHGLILGFDSNQTLRWCDQEARHQGSVSALCFNHDGSRLLAGFARGHILMLESSSGKVLRTLTDVHPPGTAVLHVKFTDSPKLALCSDSGGSVFELNFTRVMGVRGCDSKCLFSGSRGEVCTLEPLLLNQLPTHSLKNYTLVAMATLSKVIVVSIRPRMRVVLTHALGGTAIAPPQVSWQLVVIQAADSTRVVDPVLALARDDAVHFYQVCTERNSRIRLSPLQRVTVSYMISNLRWLNARSLALLDTQEKLHLLDVRLQDELETLDLSRVGISYASSHFKGLSTGGNVSKAMALAGERACYNTVIAFGSQLLLLGTKSLHAVCIRTWTERLRHLTLQRRFPEALALGLSFYQDKGQAVVGLCGSKQRRKQIARDKVCDVLIQYMDDLNHCSVENCAEVVESCVNFCIQLENTDLLFGKLWELVCETDAFRGSYLRALEGPLLNGSLAPRLPPLISQQLVTLYEQEERLDSLQAIIVLLDVDCLDIHQVTKVCGQQGLWEALIYLQTSALSDFTAPIHQLMPVLQMALANARTQKLSPDKIRLGNAILVYASCCLAGRGFPRGNLPEGVTQRAKADVLRALLSQHSSSASDAERQYPYIRTLLEFDAKGFLDVITIAFQEPEFMSEMGLRQRQRLIDILLNIVLPTTPLSPDNYDYLTDEQRAVVLNFISNEVAESSVTLEAGALNRMVEMLSTGTNNSEDMSRDIEVEKENAILQLLHSKKLTDISDNCLLNLAHNANFLRVAETIYCGQEDWISVCRCMLTDKSRRYEVWEWLDCLPLDSLQAVVTAHAAELVTVDAARTAVLISNRMPNSLDNILQKMNEDPKLEYALLGALYQLIQYGEEDIKMELTTEILEKYLKLMCDLEPERVVQHLCGPHGCRLNEVLKIVQDINHTEAIALMLEKLGNYQEAFDLLLADLQSLFEMHCGGDIKSNKAIQATSELAALCRRAAGHLDWMPLVETVLHPYTENNIQKGESLQGKLLRIVLESLSGTTTLSTVLEQILKHPLATGGTIGDIRELLTGVLTHSCYDQTLVEASARLVSMELHEALKKSLRDAGKAFQNVCLYCPVCRRGLSQCTDYAVVFRCGHGYHISCIGDSKVCYQCLRTKGWAPTVTNSLPTTKRPPEKRKNQPPSLTTDRDLRLRLAPQILLPDFEGIF